MMKEAIKKVDDGVILELEISAGAKETTIQGYNPWRKRIELRVSEKARKGKANEALISYFSDIFHVNSRNIQIIMGMTNSKKTIKITGLEMSDVLKVLTEK
jgi:uncharacterized protein (TIGR00251 family)